MLLPLLLICLASFHLSFAVPATEAPANLCSTTACKEISAFIKDSMNTSVNPCEDFYQYTCGGWMAHHHIPEWKSRTGVTEELEDVQTGQIKKLLQNFNLTTDAKANSVSVSYSAYVYQKCLELGSEASTFGVKQLKDVVKVILGNREWSIGHPANPSVVVPSWYDIYSNVQSFGSVEPVFSISIEPDSKNVTANIINLDPSDMGLGDKDLSDLNKNPKLVKAYKAYIFKAAQLLCEDKCNTAAIESDIEEIILLESALAKVKLPIEDRRDPEKTYNKLTLDELQVKTQFDWLNKILLPVWKKTGVTVPINGQTKVIVSDIGYYIKAIPILSKTSPSVIDNYFGWLAVTQHGSASSESFREAVFEFNKVHLGVTRPTERWRSCLNLANSHLNWAISRLYIDNYFTEQEKKEASNLIDEVQSAFVHLLTENPWLDAKTKNASINKLNHVVKNVAYPKWLLNNSELDNFYALENNNFNDELLHGKNYILSLARFTTNYARKEYDELNKPIDVDKNWPMPPFIVNAAYEPVQNSMTIPAGQLKAPFFDAGYPFSINYGNIGATVGHELTHGLDDEGRQYDEKGNLHNWWAEDVVERFRNRSECYVKQYAAQKEPTTGLNLNGRETLGENIADNGGLNEAFVAFKAHQSKNGVSPRLADLPQFTSEQLFYISYGNSWCSIIRVEAMRNQIEYNPHSPAQYRVNVPVSNSVEFAKAFSCPVGSPMNPANKCLLW